MAFWDEEVWEVAAWVQTGLVCWLLILYFSKRCASPFYEQLCLPRIFLSYTMHLVLLMVVQLLFSVGAYLQWRDLGWLAAAFPLAMYVAAQFLTTLAQFIFWVPFNYWGCLISAFVSWGAAATGLLATIWFAKNNEWWSVVFGAVFTAYLIIVGILAFVVAVYVETHIRNGNCCKPVSKGGWAALERGKCRPPAQPDECPVTCVVGGQGSKGKGKLTGDTTLEEESTTDQTPSGDSGDKPTNLEAALLGIELAVVGNTSRRANYNQPIGTGRKRN